MNLDLELNVPHSCFPSQQFMHKTGAVQDPNQCRIYIMLGLVGLASEVKFTIQMIEGSISCLDIRLQN